MANEIRITVTAVDGSTKLRGYKTVSKAALAFAHDAVGPTPTIAAIGGYAVSDDGTVKVSCEGCTLQDLFPEADWGTPDDDQPNKQPTDGVELKPGDRVMVDDGEADPVTGNLVRPDDTGGWVVALDDETEVSAPEPAIVKLPTEEDDEQNEDELTGSRMSIALRKARVRYVKLKRKDGQSAHCNDPIARALEGLEPDQVASLADKVCEEAAGFHYNKYAHLNPGQIRMNSGNKIRSQYKKVDEESKNRILEILLAVE